MITAIVYTSNTGTSKRYAEMLGEAIDLPVYELVKCPLPSRTKIIYIGWVMAGGIKGYKKAIRKYDVKAVCGVCMAATGTQIEELRKNNAIADSIPLFTMQGGFDINKLTGIYKFMMNMVKKFASKGLAEKEDRTAEEDDMLNMMLHGGDRVSEENLEALLEWYNKTNERE